MHLIFFKVLRCCTKHKNKLNYKCRCLLEQLWWEWSSQLDTVHDFCLMYYVELGSMLTLFLRTLHDSATEEMHINMLMRYQALSRCLDYYENILTPKHQTLSKNTVLSIKGTNQNLLSIYEKIQPQSANSTSVEIFKGPGTSVNAEKKDGL
jgi:hypothetical protein